MVFILSLLNMNNVHYTAFPLSVKGDSPSKGNPRQKWPGRFARAEYGRPAGEQADLWRNREFAAFRAALSGPWPDVPCADCSKRFEKIW